VFFLCTVGQLERNLGLAYAAEAGNCDFWWLMFRKESGLDSFKGGISTHKLLVSSKRDDPASLVNGYASVSTRR
jgi:hypothetical protein